MEDLPDHHTHSHPPYPECTGTFYLVLKENFRVEKNISSPFPCRHSPRLLMPTGPEQRSFSLYAGLSRRPQPGVPRPASLFSDSTRSYAGVQPQTPISVSRSCPRGLKMAEHRRPSGLPNLFFPTLEPPSPPDERHSQNSRTRSPVRGAPTPRALQSRKLLPHEPPPPASAIFPTSDQRRCTRWTSWRTRAAE